MRQREKRNTHFYRVKSENKLGFQKKKKTNLICHDHHMAIAQLSGVFVCVADLQAKDLHEVGYLKVLGNRLVHRIADIHHLAAQGECAKVVPSHDS
jgi:hypothetical protein